MSQKNKDNLAEILASHWQSLSPIPGALVLKKIQQDIDHELIQRISELGPRGVPPRSFASAEKRREWAEGRRCLLSLRDLLKEQGADLEKIRSSLSHCGDSVVAVACAPRLPKQDAQSTESALVSGPLKIGVDLEPADRDFRQEVSERIIHPSERQQLANWDLQFLAFWVIKEACYKANPDSKGTVVGQYFVRDFDPVTRTGHVRCEKQGQYEFRFKVLCEGGYWIAMAICLTLH